MPRWIWRRDVFTVLAIGLLAVSAGLQAQSAQAPPRPQPPQVVLSTTVNVVQVDAVVLDRAGHFVTDLKAEEVEILEDGKLQEISGFQMINLPAGPANLVPVAPALVPTDTATNARPFDGRLYIIVLDDLHITAPRTISAKRIAREFIEKNMASGDLAAVLTSSGNRSTAQGFTGDRSLLFRAIDACVGRKVISPALSTLAMGGTPEEGSPETAAPQRIFNARSALDTLTRLAAYSGTIRNRRKALVLIGEGIDYNLGDTSTTPPELRDKARDFVASASRANLILYAFDPRVATQLGDDMVDIASTPPGDLEAGSEHLKSGSVQDDAMAAQDFLKTLSVDTGGFAVTASQSFGGAFDRIRTENSSYYIVGYYPRNEAADGRFRAIEVRVKRPGVSVKARRGYTARSVPSGAATGADAKPDSTGGLRDALASALPVSGFTLRASAAAFKGSNGKASVAVVVQASGRDMLFTPKDGKLEDAIDVAVIAIDGRGTEAGGARTTVTMPLSPALQALVSQTGVIVPLRVELPAGQYQVRIAARDRGTASVGAIHYDLEVPDFSAQPLMLSGLMLTGEQAGQVPSPNPDARLQKLLSGTPVTQREFAASDTLTACAEIYENRTGDSHSVLVTETIRSEDGTVRLKHQHEYGGRSGASRDPIVHCTALPLRELGTGVRTLAVEARSTAGRDIVATRDLVFRIR